MFFNLAKNKNFKKEVVFLTITWELVLGVAGGIITIAEAFKIIKNLGSPAKNLKQKVEKHDALLDNNNKRLLSIEQTNRMMCKSMIALLDHEVTGNGIEKLKKLKTEMQDFLIDKS